MAELRKDTLINFLGAFNEREVELLLEVIQKTRRNVHLGNLPFVSRPEALSLLKEEEGDRWIKYREKHHIDVLIQKLTVVPEWINITRPTDTYTREQHIITGEIRYKVDDPFWSNFDAGSSNE